MPRRDSALDEAILAGAEFVSAKHLAEAVQYRNP